MSGTLGRIEACVPALRRYAASLLRDRQEVDDLVHDCLVRALDRLHTRQPDAELRPWLFSILHNLYVSRLRQKRVRSVIEPLDDVADSFLTVPPQQEQHITARDVVQAVQTLPEPMRSVLLLVTVEDLSYAEVAQTMNISIGTVMSRLSRARERLRKMS